jgi:hypothetical protein
VQAVRDNHGAVRDPGAVVGDDCEHDRALHEQRDPSKQAVVEEPKALSPLVDRVLRTTP